MSGPTVQERKYTRDHEWIELEKDGKTGTVFLLPCLPLPSSYLSILPLDPYSTVHIHLSAPPPSPHLGFPADSSTSTGTIGITTYAAKNLGDVVYVELPSHGLQATQGDAIGAVESVKSASDILTPVSGTIVGVNEALEESPGLINKDPEGEGGWIARIEVSERGRGEFETKDPPPKQGEGEGEGEQYQGLMSEIEYGQFTAE